MPNKLRLAPVLAVLVVSCSPLWSYGPLNHLCVVNRNWKIMWKLIEPIGYISENEARRAAFAGALVDDVGYYPVPGSETLKLLTDTMHYTQTGDWVAMQLRDAKAKPTRCYFRLHWGNFRTTRQIGWVTTTAPTLWRSRWQKNRTPTGRA